MDSAEARRIAIAAARKEGSIRTPSIPDGAALAIGVLSTQMDDREAKRVAERLAIRAGAKLSVDAASEQDAPLTEDEQIELMEGIETCPAIGRLMLDVFRRGRDEKAAKPRRKSKNTPMYW